MVIVSIMSIFNAQSQQERFDDDLRHYYELLADKGELQAQVGY